MFELDGITEAGRAFVFKLSLCNPFARSAGIFLGNLSNLSIYSVRAFHLTFDVLESGMIT